MASWKPKSKKQEGWVVKNIRPDEFLQDPLLYYTDDEVEKYARSGGMRRAQEKIANRVLEFLKLEPESSLLDLGSGPGLTAEIYRDFGYEVTCLDLVPKMAAKAEENGFEAFTGDMKDVGDILKGRKFAGVVSVSALQWMKSKEDIQQLAQGIYSLLEKDSPLIIQFYPKSEQEMKETAKVFVQNGFEGEIKIDWPEIPKNRTIFLVLKRK